MAEQQFILEVIWHRDGLPSLVGPFETAEEAETWARLNVPNGLPILRALTYPYMRVQP